MTAPAWLDWWWSAGGDAGLTGRRLAARFRDCETAADVASRAAFLGIPAPAGRSPEGVLQRAQSPRYWRAWVKVEGARHLEQRRRRAGLVRKGVSEYVSAEMLERFIARDREGRRYLEEEMIAISDHGDELTVAELADNSPTNPEHKRAELMVRVKGFERYGEQAGHCWTFATLTLPGEWHAWYADNGRPVASYNGSRPDDGQRELMRRWVCARAELARLGVRMYGFRVVEPHHDGTPHWHMLIWCEHEGRLAEWKFVIERYFGSASSAAVEFEDHDPEKGGASSYIAKYVSKNIDGHGLSEGERDGATRAVVWSRLWRARQFQQLGGPPVSVWRELRRIRSDNELAPAMRPAWQAATAGDWCAFIEAMGGPFRGRDYQIQLARGWKLGINGERTPERNCWGEPLVTDDYDLRPIIGLVCGLELVLTYSKFWTIERKKPLPERAPVAAEGRASRTRVINCTAPQGPP